MTLVSAAAARALRLPPARNRVTSELGVRLPVPDGVELVTDLYLATPLEPRPSVLIRTPYGRSRLVWVERFAGALLISVGVAVFFDLFQELSYHLSFFTRFAL